MHRILLSLIVLGGALAAQPALAGSSSPDEEPKAASPVTDGEDYKCKDKKKGMHESYGELDADGDGAVTLDEFVEAHRSQVEAKFERVDADGDGSVSEAEFTEHREHMREKWKHHKKMKKHHGDYGEDKDGDR